MRMRYALSPLPPGPLFIPCSNPLCIYVPDRMNHSLLKKKVEFQQLRSANGIAFLCCVLVAWNVVNSVMSASQSIRKFEAVRSCFSVHTRPQTLVRLLVLTVNIYDRLCPAVAHRW